MARRPIIKIKTNFIAELSCVSVERWWTNKGDEVGLINGRRHGEQSYLGQRLAEAVD